MPALSDLSPIGDNHKIKFFGSQAAEAARDFFSLPIQLPASDYLVSKEAGQIHVHGLKSGISKCKFSDPNVDQEFGDGVIIYSIPGHPTVVIHQAQGSDQSGSFALVKKLIPVADQVAQFQQLKGKTYKAGEEEMKAADSETMATLLKQIQAAYSAKAAEPEKTKAPKKETQATARPKPKPAPQPTSSYQQSQTQYQPSYRTSNYSPSSG